MATKQCATAAAAADAAAVSTGGTSCCCLRCRMCGCLCGGNTLLLLLHLPDVKLQLLALQDVAVAATALAGAAVQGTRCSRDTTSTGRQRCAVGACAHMNMRAINVLWTCASMTQNCVRCQAGPCCGASQTTQTEQHSSCAPRSRAGANILCALQQQGAGMIPHLRPAARGASRIVLTPAPLAACWVQHHGAVAIAAVTLRLLL